MRRFFSNRRADFNILFPDMDRDRREESAEGVRPALIDKLNFKFGNTTISDRLVAEAVTSLGL
jgi:hypothetical protein